MSVESPVILIVDDEEMVRINLETFLEDEGFDILSASSGEEAEQVLKDSSADLGIIDMRLPDMDGQTLILKAYEIYPHMKFIIHTGSLDYVLPKQLISIGMSNDNICHKPISDMEALIDKLLSLVKE